MVAVGVLGVVLYWCVVLCGVPCCLISLVCVVLVWLVCACCACVLRVCCFVCFVCVMCCVLVRAVFSVVVVCVFRLRVGVCCFSAMSVVVV